MNAYSNPVNAAERARSLPIRPRIEDIIASITRHKDGPGDMTYTYQFPVTTVMDPNEPYVNLPRWHHFTDLIQQHIDVVPDNKRLIVWCMGGSGRLGTVKDQTSLEAAVLDHQNYGKTVVELFVVDHDGELWVPREL